MSSVFRWASMTPDMAVRAIFASGNGSGIPMAWEASAKPGQFSLGFVANEDRPSLVVVKEEGAVELLAWIATYSPEAFPLSQTVRIVSQQELEAAKRLSDGRKAVDHDFIWSSIVLGEMLAQSDGRNAADRLPISRAHSCFSFPMARTQYLYTDSTIPATTVRRLEQMEQDPIFQRRPLAVKELARIWGLADSLGDQASSLRLIIDSVMAPVSTSSHRPSPPFVPDLSAIEVNIERMSHGPLEQRVVEFERSGRALLARCKTDIDYQDRAPMYLAAFAFWVGSGTSHISLLDEFSSAYPACYAWFGLLAGLAGPSAWDGRWLRGASAVERLIRTPFFIGDPPNVDLSWVEYKFIYSQKHPSEWVKELPKLSMNALSVEVIAGASCQMKLAGHEQASSKVDRRAVADGPRFPDGEPLSIEGWERINRATELLLSVIRHEGRDKGFTQEDLFGGTERNSAAAASAGKKKVISRSKQK